MSAIKRQKKSRYTPQTSKKPKQEKSKSPDRVYYSGNFDLFNYTDLKFLNSLSELIPNCHLIIGIEDNFSDVFSVSEQEESLKRTGLVKQIIYPAPQVNEEFLNEYNVQWVIAESIEKFAGINEEKVKIVARNQENFKDELVSRVLADKNKFVARCMDKGYDRRQLGVSLLQELSIKFSRKFGGFRQHWGFFNPNLRVLRKYKKLFYRIEDNQVIKDTQT